MKRILIFCLLLISCTNGKRTSPLPIGDRIRNGESVILMDSKSERALYVNPYYDRNIGAHTVALRDQKDPYNVIPMLVLDKIVEEELWNCSEPLGPECVELFHTLMARLDWPYVLVKEGESLASIAAKECGGSKNAKILRKFNFPYGECVARADKNDQGLCVSIAGGIPLRIPPACR